MLLMQNILHAKRVCKDFKITNFGEYHDLYVESDTLLLVDIFENFRNMYLVTYELDFAKKFFIWISMVSSSKKGQSKIRSFN